VCWGKNAKEVRIKTQLSKPARNRSSYIELKPYYHRIKLHPVLLSDTN